MAEYELYCFGESGNSYKAALMLALCALDWSPRKVAFMDGETRSEAFRSEVNEMGECPTLAHRGRLLSQSGAILDYLVQRTGRFGWSNDDERREVLRWLLFDNHKFTSYLATYRFMTHFMKLDNEVTKFFKARADSALKIVDKHLAAHEWIALDRPTIADISMAGYLYYDGELGVDFAALPAIAAWRERIRKLPGWRAPYQLMPRASAA
ncbi:MAG: glutathione S-transferase family protein [Burkholderiales bacterium]